MKKLKVALLLICTNITVILIILSACTGYTTIGIENYPTIYDDFEINWFLVPEGILDKTQNGIITDFPYESAYYYAHEGNMFTIKGEASVTILSIVYDEENYSQAKQYMLENTDYSKEVHYSYNKYEFYENLALPRHKRELVENGKNDFGLNYFNMICYNDFRQTLIFLGFHHSLNEPNEIYEQQGWGGFLKKYFPQYDFDTGAPVESYSSTSSN